VIANLECADDGKDFPHFIGVDILGDHRPEQGGGGVVEEGKGCSDVQHPFVDAKCNHELIDETKMKELFIVLSQLSDLCTINFINILHTCFSYKILAPKITKLKCN